MSRTTPLGEYALCGLFAALGLVWVGVSWRMPFWEGFAPQSGFLPFVYGLCLLGLSAATAASLARSTEPPTYSEGSAEEPLGKPALILAGLIACVVGLPVAGFLLSILLLLLFLFIVVERLPLLSSTLAAVGTTAALHLIFKVWLGVPLPAGPFGS